MRFLVFYKAAPTFAHLFAMVGWADIDGSVVGSQWERVHRLALIDDLLHGAAVGLVCDPSVLLAVKVHNHKVEGVGWRFQLF